MAEVLITIGIIGVVAALTIPTLLQNTNNYKFQTRFKKAVSTLAQAPISAQSQYDTDYSTLTDNSDDTNCANNAIASGNLTMCGLFNNTLSEQSYQGVYGVVKGADQTNPYTIETTTQGFNPENYLIYSLADGTIVGFKPSAKGCSLASGAVLSSELMTKAPTESDTSGLADCIGFIDVNGVQPPNKEVTCSTGASSFDTRPCFIRSSGTAISDVFPIVFHDSTVEPATGAARAVMARGKSTAEGAEEATTEPEPTQEEQTPHVCDSYHLDDCTEEECDSFASQYRHCTGNTCYYLTFEDGRCQVKTRRKNTWDDEIEDF